MSDSAMIAMLLVVCCVSGMPYPDLKKYGLTMRICRLPFDAFGTPSGSRPAFLPSLMEQDAYQHLVSRTKTKSLVGTGEGEGEEDDEEFDSGRGATVTNSQDLPTTIDGSDITSKPFTFTAPTTHILGGYFYLCFFLCKKTCVPLLINLCVHLYFF